MGLQERIDQAIGPRRKTAKLTTRKLTIRKLTIRKLTIRNRSTNHSTNHRHLQQGTKL